MCRPHEGHTLGQGPAADAGLSLLEVGKVVLTSSGADVIVATTVTNRYCYYFFYYHYQNLMTVNMRCYILFSDQNSRFSVVCRKLGVSRN
jgi:hypothetical protein